MDHTYVEENQIADRYVMGTLPAEEAERFENHYLSCPECLDRLELSESVQRGFRRMAGQDVARLSAARQLAVVAWLARLGRRRQIGVLLSALLVLPALPSGLALHENTQLAQARSTLKNEQQRVAAAGTLRAELDASRRALAGEREGRARAEGLLAQASQPQGNVPILFLDAERGTGSPGSEPTHSLRQPPAGGWVFLAPTIDPSNLPSYRAVLRDGHGREISRVEGLHADERGTLSLSLPARLLPPGDYSITIEPTAQRFNFRVLPRAEP